MMTRCMVEEGGKFCLHELAYNSSTTAMHLHLYGKHTAFMAKAETPKLFEGAQEAQSEEKPYAKGSPQYGWRLKALCEFLAEDMRPLHLVKGKGFRNFVRILDPKFRLPTRPELEVGLYELYNMKKSQLVTLLEKVCTVR